MSNTMLGLMAREVGSPYAGFIDAGAGVLTGSLSGGNFKNAFDSYRAIGNGNKVYYNTFSIYNTGKGYYDLSKETMNLKK